MTGPRQSGPGPSEVHVWMVPTEDPPLPVPDLESLLSGDELERAGRFRLEADRTRFTVTRGVLRLLLGGYVGREPRDLRFTYGGHGKPELSGGGPMPPSFNASHSGGWALVGVTLRDAVGVDVERVRPMQDLERIASRQFSPAEAEVIEALPEAQRLPAFFACWTRKEACLKALGSGLSIPLDRIVVPILAEDTVPRCAVRRLPGVRWEGAEWTLWSLVPETGYVAAVATSLREADLVSRIWTGSRGVTEFR